MTIGVIKSIGRFQALDVLEESRMLSSIKIYDEKQSSNFSKYLVV
jgi:hypothetical protein